MLFGPSGYRPCVPPHPLGYAPRNGVLLLLNFIQPPTPPLFLFGPFIENPALEALYAFPPTSPLGPTKLALKIVEDRFPFLPYGP